MHKTTSLARTSAPDLSQVKSEEVNEPCGCLSLGDAENNQNQDQRDPPKDIVPKDTRLPFFVAGLFLESQPVLVRFFHFLVRSALLQNIAVLQTIITTNSPIYNRQN
jgi:hypothetical protein